MSVKKNKLVSAKKITLILDTTNKTPPFLESLSYYFQTPFNEIAAKKFLIGLTKRIGYITKEWKVGPTRMVSSGRIWSKRKIQDDILNS